MGFVRLGFWLQCRVAMVIGVAGASGVDSQWLLEHVRPWSSGAAGVAGGYGGFPTMLRLRTGGSCSGRELEWCQRLRGFAWGCAVAFVEVER